MRDALCIHCWNVILSIFNLIPHWWNNGRIESLLFRCVYFTSGVSRGKCVAFCFFPVLFYLPDNVIYNVLFPFLLLFEPFGVYFQKENSKVCHYIHVYNIQSVFSDYLYNICIITIIYTAYSVCNLLVLVFRCLRYNHRHRSCRLAIYRREQYLYLLVFNTVKIIITELYVA